MALTDKLTAIANAIRGKTGKADALTLDQMATEIEAIEAGTKVEIRPEFLDAMTGYSFEMNLTDYVFNKRGLNIKISAKNGFIFPSNLTETEIKNWKRFKAEVFQMYRTGADITSYPVYDASFVDRIPLVNNLMGGNFFPIFIALPDKYTTSNGCYLMSPGYNGAYKYFLHYGISFGRKVEGMHTSWIYSDIQAYGEKPVYVDEGFKGTLYLERISMSAETMVNIFNNLADISQTAENYTLGLGPTNIAKLTNEELNIAYAKGWEIE